MDIIKCILVIYGTCVKKGKLVTLCVAYKTMYNLASFDKIYSGNLVEACSFEIPLPITWGRKVATFLSIGSLVICTVRSSILWSFSLIMFSRCEIFCCNVEIISFFSCSSCFRRIKTCRGTVLFATSSGFSTDFTISKLCTHRMIQLNYNKWENKKNSEKLREDNRKIIYHS